MLAIANEYGNVDLTRQRLPKRYRHIPGKRLQPICRKLKIRFCEAVVDFDGNKKYGYRPICDGVVVSAKSAEKLLIAIAIREERANSPKVIAARERAKVRREEKQEEKDRYY